MAVAAVVVSEPLVADLFALPMLDLDRAALSSLIQSVVTPAVAVASEVPLLVVSVATVASKSPVKLPEELVASTTLASNSVALVAQLVVAVSAVAKVPPLALKPPEELVASTTKVANVDKLVSNVEAALVAFVPLALAQSTLDRASLAVVDSAASAPPATDTTRDGEYNMTKCSRTFFWKESI